MFISFLLLCTILADIWLSWVLGGLTGLGIFLAALPVTIFLLIGGALALGLIGMIFGQPDDRSQLKRFFTAFLKGWAGLVCFVWIAPWLLFGALQATNNYFPAVLPKVTITNGEKTVVFQSMMHIASPGFYEDIKKDMELLAVEDYVFFYEGVKPGTPESMAKLSQLMGMEVSEDMYDIIANIAGLKFQGDIAFEQIMPSINIDLSTDEIVAIAEKNQLQPPVVTETQAIEAFKKAYPEFNGTQKYVTQVLSRGLMNVMLRSYMHPELLEQLQMEVPVMDIIVTERNKHLAEAIIDSPSQKIYIHYGALHFAGMLEELQKSDPRWREVSRTGLSVIR